jgi:uncharacterized protein YdeI (YjbR/CyaY-like superfamily)
MWTSGRGAVGERESVVGMARGGVPDTRRRGINRPMTDRAEPETFFALDRAAWRAWLEEHHAATREIWLVLLKTHVRRPSVNYEEAVQEALCLGWIDGMLRRMDDESHMVRFTPRKPGSMWSPSNKARVERLIAERRMTPTGLALVEEAKRGGEWDKAEAREDVTAVPEDLAAALEADAMASAAWERLAPSHRKQYLYWIGEAKRAETRARRVAETVARAGEGRRPGT